MTTRLAAAAILLAVSANPAFAGCATGALVGAGLGHLAHHHAVLGGVAGCAIGHHHAKVEARHRQADEQQQAERNRPNSDQYTR